LKLAAQCRSKEEASRYEELRRGIEFDGVLRLQREAFYRDRAAVLEADAAELKTLVLKMVYEELAQLPFLVPDGRAQKSTLLDEVGVVFGSAVSAELKRYLARKKPADRAEPEKWLAGKLADRYENWEKAQGIECLAEVVRLKLLEGLDRQWAEYLSPLEELRKGIYLRSYGGQNPLREYQRDGYRLWQEFQTLTRKTLLQEIFTGNLIISGDSGNHLA
jgi:preprotein translocase subunit SecA